MYIFVDAINCYRVSWWLWWLVFFWLTAIIIVYILVVIRLSTLYPLVERLYFCHFIYLRNSDVVSLSLSLSILSYYCQPSEMTTMNCSQLLLLLLIKPGESFGTYFLDDLLYHISVSTPREREREIKREREKLPARRNLGHATLDGGCRPAERAFFQFIRN